MNLLRMFLLAPALVLMVFPGAVYAEKHQGFYAGVYYGAAADQNVIAVDSLGRYTLDTKIPLNISGSLGYDLPPDSLLGKGRIELTYFQQQADFDRARFTDGRFTTGGDFQVQSLMLSSYAVYETSPYLALYLGGGIGAARVKVDQLTIDQQPMLNDTKTVLAGQLGVGVEVALTSWLRADLGYRYFLSKEPEFKDNTGRELSLDVNSHNAILGLVVLF
jgi:opacity protein-like surface antigen